MKKNIDIIVDVDDIVLNCNETAIRYLNEEKGLNLTVNDIKGWSETGSPADGRLKYFGDPEFMKSLPLYPGAKKFISELCKIANVFFCTAVRPQCVGARMDRLIKEFPEVPPENIILGTRKDLIHADIMLDDGAHNILASSVKYPVLFRRPWNNHLSGVLAVNNYEDFLNFVKMVATSFQAELDLKDSGVVCLVGPSGSGKTAITQELVKLNGFEKPITTTTRKKRTEETEDAYRFTDTDTFLNEMSAGKFLETSVYSENYYGTTGAEISRILDAGRYAVVPIDICGAISIKNKFKEKAVLIFVDRNKKSVVRQIVGRNCSDDEKTTRIISLDHEYKNKEFCDFVVKNDSTISAAAEMVKGFIENAKG